jgi:plastocyanin
MEDKQLSSSSPSKRSVVWVIVLVVVVAAAVLYVRQYGNPFKHQASVSMTQAATITIANCDTIAPQSVSLLDGATITFVNTDSSLHHISVGGEEMDVPAKSKVELKAKFQYGTGTYGYACDGKLTPNQIVLIPVPGSAAIIKVTLKSVYDNAPVAMQSCFKSALGTEFDKAYGDANYVPSNDSVKKVNDCLISAAAQTATKK